MEPREEIFQEGKTWSPVVFITAAMKRCEGLQETLGSNRNSKTQMDFFFPKMKMAVLNKMHLSVVEKHTYRTTQYGIC